jgi:Ca-activated chloride channel family protein
MDYFYHFDSPGFLWVLLIIPVMLWDYFRTQKKRKATIRFPGLQIAKKTNQGLILRIRHLLIFMRSLALAFLIIALARPQSGESLEEITTQGLDIMMVLDLSGSMDLLDMLSTESQSKLGRLNAEKMYRSGEYKKYSRLGFSKKVIEDFINKRTNDRIGLTVFASRAYNQCPLTLDYGILTEILRSQESGLITPPGTAIGTGLLNGIQRLEDSDAKSKIVILLTDGANNAGVVHPIKAAQAAQALGVKVYTIGVGKSSGSVMQFRQNPFTGEILWGQMDLQPGEGIDEPMLKEMAKLTGGRFFKATNEKELSEIYEIIDGLEKTEIKTWSYTKYQEEFFIWLLLGAVVLFAEIILANTRFLKIP